MDSTLTKQFDELSSKDDKVRMEAFQTILHATDEKVDWVYEVWDKLIQMMGNDNSYQRSIAIMLLCNLAKSDRENRMNVVIDSLLKHTRDEKFITSRQCLQNIWKVALANPDLKAKVLTHLEEQFINCVDGKHYNLIRQDIIQSLKNLSNTLNEPSILERACTLVQLEENPKFRKKFNGILLE